PFLKLVRKRDKAHRQFVCSQPCLICGRRPSDAHHLRFGQPRALGRRVSDEFLVPLCRVHHRDLHRRGDEKEWWEAASMDPIEVAQRLWREAHPREPPARRRAPPPPPQQWGCRRPGGAGGDPPPGVFSPGPSLSPTPRGPSFLPPP